MNFSSWIKAFRLRTLPLALSGWLVGVSLATSIHAVNWTVALLTLLTACLLQVLSNLANDYGDAVSGVDSGLRAGPKRMVQIGAISTGGMRRAIGIIATLCFICGSALLLVAFPSDYMVILIFLLVGLLAIAAAIKYTVGKNPYGYTGFGDLFVFFFFGIVLVFGTYYLQTQSLDFEMLLPATSIGLFSVGVLNVNNIRDMVSDKLAGKNSIPVRLGRTKSVVYHGFLLFGGILSSVLFVSNNFESWWQWSFVLVCFPFVTNLRAVASRSLDELDPYLRQMALSTLLFSILFSIGMITS